MGTVPKGQGFDYEFLDDQVTESRPFYYYVTDSNCASAGAIPLGRPSPGAAPAPPTSLTANWSGSGAVTLNWVPSVGTVTGYRIWRNVSSGQAMASCSALEPGTVCPTEFSRGTTTGTSFADVLSGQTQVSYQVSAYSISHGNENYSTPATVTIACGPAIVTVPDATLTLCPGGDAQVLRIDASLHDLCDQPLTNPNLSVCAVKQPTSTPGIRLWMDSGAGYVARDTLPGSYSPATRIATVQHSRVSGCGTLLFDIVVNGQVVATNVAIEVRSTDQDGHVTGSVDRFDQAALSSALLGGGSPCWNLDWQGTVDFADFNALQPHVSARHHVPRKLISPNGGNLYSPGSVVPISWQAAAGDSARVTLSLVRTTPASTVLVAADILDTGSSNWTVPGTIPAGSTWRMQVLHSAGYSKVDNLDVGTDQSDATFTILPNPVSDLIADAAKTSAMIAWSDPIQGDGVAQAHEIRYMVNTPITNTNFSQGTLVPSDALGPPGTTHCVTVDPVQSCRTYSFGMRTKSGNVWSLISNVATASTMCSGSAIVSCDFGGLLAGGGEGGGESSRPSSLATASSRPVSMDGEGARENSVLGGVPSGMVEDLYRLPVIESDLLSAPLIVLREAGTRSVELDAVGLGTVDHAVGTEAIAGTSAVLVGSITPVERVVDSDGSNVSAILKPGAGPGLWVRGGGALVVQLGGEARNAALVVESRGRAGIVRGDSLGILVQRPDRSGGWTTIARINPRRGFDRQAIASEGAATLRLVFLKEYELQSLARLGVSATVSPQPLALTDATHSRLGAVDGAVDQRGGAKTTLAMGDTLAVRFILSAVAPGTTRSHFLSIRGSLLAATTDVASAEGALIATTGAPSLEFGLEAARPNPSTGSTVIAYSLPSAARAELAIYGVSGRRVRTLLSSDRTAGAYEQSWDGRDEIGRVLPAGVYFYRLRAGDWMSERKLILLQR